MSENTEKLEILVVDDEVEYRMAMEIILSSEGYGVTLAKSAEEAIEVLKNKSFDIVMSDLIMGGLSGIELLEHIKENYPDTDVIIITGFGTVQNAVEAMKLGAYTYFVKSHDPDALKKEVAKLSTLKRIRTRNAEAKLADEMQSFLMETKSTKFKRVLKLAEMAADSSSNILIIGESGVGKEVFAKYIHACSRRAKGPFVAVNCNALSDNLLESELFGHEKGSFTGANSKRVGRFEAAQEGTLLIDELGEMNLSTQVKLLRTLEDKKIERIGGNESVQVDFRLLCATNKPLKEAIQNGHFREDLYFRISTIVIEIPPLRERKEDLPDLIQFFFSKAQSEMNKEIKGIEDGVFAELMAYDYPGNVRELKNMIERLVVLTEDGYVKKKYMFIESPNENPAGPSIDIDGEIRPLKDVRKEMEAEYIRDALDKCGQNVAEAAKRLGISKRQLFNKINEYDLRQ